MLEKGVTAMAHIDGILTYIHALGSAFLSDDYDNEYQALMDFSNHYEGFNPIIVLKEKFNLTQTEISLVCLWMSSSNGETDYIQTFTLACLKQLDSASGFSYLIDRNEVGVHLLNVVEEFINGNLPTMPHYATLSFVSDQSLFHSKQLLGDLKKTYQTASIVNLVGELGSGKRFLLSTLAQELTVPYLELDANDYRPFDDKLLIVTSMIYQPVICITNYTNQSKQILHMLDFSTLFFTSNEVKHEFGFIDKPFLVREVQPSVSESTQLMQFLLSHIPFEEDVTFYEIQASYKLTLLEIVRLKNKLLAEQIISDAMISKKQLIHTIYTLNDNAMSELAKKFETDKTFSDLMLPEVQKQQLVEICEFSKVKEKVFDDYGFSSKVSYGKGMSVLFYGASGTGKTFAATILANEIGLELFRVDISRLISKYIGETQKNIDNVFTKAEKCKCILFFDEADALFSKRSDVSDSQDKHANAEVSYLLQRTESYEGITILATNLLQNFDEAFRRRINYMIQFPFPDKTLRKLIWETVFPKIAPLDCIDFDLLANEFELSGAGIKNSALHAGFLAASDHDVNSKITIQHIIQGIKNEYTKVGKVLTNQQLYIG